MATAPVQPVPHRGAAPPVRPVIDRPLGHDGAVDSTGQAGPVPGREQDAALVMRTVIGSWSALAAFSDGAGLSLDPAVVALRHTHDPLNAALVLAPDLDAVGRVARWYAERPWQAWSASEETTVLLAALGHRPVGSRVAMVAPSAPGTGTAASGLREAAPGEVLELIGIPREALAAGSGLIALVTDDSGTGALLFAGDAAAGVSHLAVRTGAADRRAEVLDRARAVAAARDLGAVAVLADASDEALHAAAGFEPVARWTVCAAPAPPLAD
jgi:hypothetical protein